MRGTTRTAFGNFSLLKREALIASEVTVGESGMRQTETNQLSRELFLCGGTQSSGSTLVSWCFLQRPDMNGHLDADNDLLPALPLRPTHTWYKTTVCSFRLTELMSHFQDDGWNLHPLLVIRDVRQVWASLCKKPYGKNGITAEDPPLRLRLRRFKEDWELFRQRGWATLRYESFVVDPQATLQSACEQLGLDWDKSMLTWPKKRSQIADTRHGNQTFRESCGQGLLASLRQTNDSIQPGSIPPADLEWMETEFAEFNLQNGYPEHLAIPHIAANGIERAIPSVEVTRRIKWELRRKPLLWIGRQIGLLSQNETINRA